MKKMRMGRGFSHIVIILLNAAACLPVALAEEPADDRSRPMPELAATGQTGPCQDDGSGCAEPILVLPQPDINGFDRELFTSNGSNTSDVFDADNYFQATFRLSRSEGGEDFVGDWVPFLKMVSFLKNAADSVHGIPLVITKALFTAPQPDAPPEVQTFFMAALTATTIFHQDITILSSPAFQLSADPVERIQLQIEGRTIDVDPAGNTPVEFASQGEKTILATVRFASGFVGENLFRVVVEGVVVE